MVHRWVGSTALFNCWFNLTRSFSQREIMGMECDFLVQNLKNPMMIVAVKETIKRVSDGSSPHCVGALDLVLEKIFESKRRSQSVQLRCTSTRCSWGNGPVPYSSVGSNIYCPRCSCWMTCGGCQYRRTNNYPSCQGCRKNFV